MFNKGTSDFWKIGSVPGMSSAAATQEVEGCLCLAAEPSPAPWADEEVGDVVCSAA